jgi:putative 2-oxoglutarate-Fe(II)-dependent oxygenase superfamily protein
LITASSRSESSGPTQLRQRSGASAANLSIGLWTSLRAYPFRDFRPILNQHHRSSASDTGIVVGNQWPQPPEERKMRVLSCSSDNSLMLSALWATFIHKRRYGKHEDHKHLIVRSLREIKAASDGSKKQPENVDLFESRYDLFESCGADEYLGDLIQFIKATLFEVVTSVNADYWVERGLRNADISIKIIDSWFVDYQDGGFVLPHAHGGSWSCVYYLQSNDSDTARNGSTYLLSPRGKIDDRHDLGNSYLSSSSFVVPALEGELIVFPAHLIHGSFPSKGEDNKIIISANAEFRVA